MSSYLVLPRPAVPKHVLFHQWKRRYHVGHGHFKLLKPSRNRFQTSDKKKKKMKCWEQATKTSNPGCTSFQFSWVHHSLKSSFLTGVSMLSCLIQWCSGLAYLYCWYWTLEMRYNDYQNSHPLKSLRWTFADKSEQNLISNSVHVCCNSITC